MEDKKLFTTTEAAQALGITDGRLRQLIMRGEFTPKRKIGRFWVLDEAEIEELRARPKQRSRRPKK